METFSDKKRNGRAICNASPERALRKGVLTAYKDEGLGVDQQNAEDSIYFEPTKEREKLRVLRRRRAAVGDSRPLERPVV